ncbi:MAG: MBL fold metallo-hydrolase [Deltaproteobacteria bacterium HGW-Deltaproteobacteria-14]|jgi:glyoxylase-like metal-dependent hydrolase (beta-lactamase superfamily II)|nr:MAG: MBL fold metallo-hydrolase [Deltaproteobacteria bacterium HGW-Deltaproteobacteria-14]
MEIKAFFHESSFTLTYLVWDPATRDAVVIDPVLDLDLLTWKVTTSAIDEIAAFVAARDLKVHWVADTHVHADHLTGMAVLKAKLGAPTAISREITTIQDVFGTIFNVTAEVPTDGRQFDRLLDDGEVLRAGSLSVEAIHTPGHTPACMTYKIGDAIFTGDALFMPDYGTGRCDFPRGSADDLYDSIVNKIYTLPEDTRVFVGHDYMPNGRELQYETTVGASRAGNIQLRATTPREDFVAFREARDKTLNPPRFILPSLQVNIRAGELPPAENNGRVYFKMPIGLF